MLRPARTCDRQLLCGQAIHCGRLLLNGMVMGGCGRALGARMRNGAIWRRFIPGRLCWCLRPAANSRKFREWDAVLGWGCVCRASIEAGIADSNRICGARRRRKAPASPCGGTRRATAAKSMRRRSWGREAEGFVFGFDPDVDHASFLALRWVGVFVWQRRKGADGHGHDYAAGAHRGFGVE